MASHQNGRLQSRPNAQKNLGSNTTGLRETGLETERDGLLYVPESFNPKKPTPLIVMLHAGGGKARQSVDALREFADRTGVILLAPQSQGVTWDAIKGGFGTDVYFIDEALLDVFALYPIDTKRIAVAGFSDGASYALSLASVNSDLFTHVLAFSPGFTKPEMVPEAKKQMPQVFLAHGKRDEVLPIDKCSRALVPKLKESGIEVTYQEFDGAHAIPSDVARTAVSWFLGREAIAESRGVKVRSTQSDIGLL